jgi:hypothetical protein
MLGDVADFGHLGVKLGEHRGENLGIGRIVGSVVQLERILLAIEQFPLRRFITRTGAGLTERIVVPVDQLVAPSRTP